jgi:hypothetical protein
LGHSAVGVTEKHYVKRTGDGPDVRSVLDQFGGQPDPDPAEAVG